MTLDKTGDYILVASQDANAVEVFKVDHATGQLTRTDTADAPCAADVAIA